MARPSPLQPLLRWGLISWRSRGFDNPEHGLDARSVPQTEPAHPRWSARTPLRPIPDPGEVETRRVAYRVDDDIALEVRYLKGELIPEKTRLPVFDYPTSFTIKIHSADIALFDTLSLSRLLNRYVLVTRARPIGTCTSRLTTMK